MALSSTPCFFAHLWLMTLVQAISAATIVSVGVGPMLVPSRSFGSSMTVLTSRTEISVREWVGQSPRIRCVTVAFSFTAGDMGVSYVLHSSVTSAFLNRYETAP